jgi:hypothetical protein
MDSIPEEKCMRIRFQEVRLEGASGYGLEDMCVQLYLDDTSNGYMGIGNTAFIKMSTCKHLDAEQKGMQVKDFEWFMTGAEACDHKMPDTVKMVVTANVMGVSNVAGEVNKCVHGTVGGCVVPLEEFLSKETTIIPIYNSFFPDSEESIVTVKFKVQDQQKTLEEFRSKRESGLFHASAIPCNEDCSVVKNFLPCAINRLWVEKVNQGVYCAPSNAPKDFDMLPDDAKLSIIATEPGLNMFRSGFTPNARLKGQMYPHEVASLPAMNNEAEQTGITNARVLLHASHAAFTMFKGYGWSTRTFMQKVISVDDDDRAREQLASFLVYTLCAQHNLPSTQEYVSDYWIVKVCFCCVCFACDVRK